MSTGMAAKHERLEVRLSRRIQPVFVVMALSGGLAGATACDRTPAAVRRDAVATQRQASLDIRRNNQQAAETIDQAQAVEARAVAASGQQVDEAQQKAWLDNAQVRAKANETIAADVDALGAGAGARGWGQKKLDELNNQIDHARTAAQKSPPKARAAFESGIEKVQKERDALMSELAFIETGSEQEASAFKTRVNAEVDRLETRVEKLERAL